MSLLRHLLDGMPSKLPYAGTVVLSLESLRESFPAGTPRDEVSMWVPIIGMCTGTREQAVITRVCTCSRAQLERQVHESYHRVVERE